MSVDSPKPQQVDTAELISASDRRLISHLRDTADAPLVQPADVRLMCDAANRIEQLALERATERLVAVPRVRLENRVAAYEGALRPFAAAGDAIVKEYEYDELDDVDACTFHGGDCGLTIGDLRRAAAALRGDCVWSGCPQRRDGEPAKTGRSCPLYNWSRDDE